MTTPKATNRFMRIKPVAIETLKHADWNPRFIRRDRLENLKRSIEADPEFMWQRPILAMADGTVYAGNQRLQACQELGWKQIPALVGDVPEELARQRAVRDNNSWGEWNDDALVAFIKEIASVGDDAQTQTLGFTDAALSDLLKTLDQEQRAATSGLRVNNPTEDADDDMLMARQRDGQTPGEAMEVWEQSIIRQIVLYYQTDQFREINDLLADVRDQLDIDNNTDAITYVLKDYHANHCTPGQGARSEPVQDEIGAGE